MKKSIARSLVFFCIPALVPRFRTILLLILVLAVAQVHIGYSAYGGVGTFTKITTLADLSDGYYVIANSTDNQAMNYTNTGYFLISPISPSANSLVNPHPSIVWLISSDAGKKTIYNEVGAKHAAYWGSGNNAYGVDVVTNDSARWVFGYATAFYVTNGLTVTRVLQYNASSPRFACYTSAQVKLSLFKMATVSGGPSIVITNGGATVSVNSYTLCGTNDGVVGTLLFSNTTTGVEYTQAAPGAPYGWSQTLSSLALGANSVQVIGTNTAGTRGVAYTTITYAPPLPAAASNIVAVTTPAASVATMIGTPVSIVTESWSNHAAQIGYGATTSGNGWLWFGVPAYAGGVGYTGSVSFTMPIGTNYIGARWIGGAITNYGWSSAGQINAISLASTLYVWVTNTPPMLLTTPWDFTNGSLNGVSCGAGMVTNFTTSGGTLVDEGFNNGTTPPSGWTFTGIDSTYTSAGNYGRQSPSIGMNSSNERVETPTFTNPTGVTFWIKGQSTDASSSLLVESYNGFSWSTVATISPLPTTASATTNGYSLDSTVQRLRFTYTKSVGNLAFDDVIVTGQGASSDILAINGFSHSATADADSNVTFTINTSSYQLPGFYCAVRRDSTGPRLIDLDFYNGTFWETATATYELSAAGVWYTIGRTFADVGAAGTAFRLVGYGATGSQLQIKDAVVTAPVPEPMLLGVAGMALLACFRRNK